MGHNKYMMKSLSACDPEPFGDAQEAWLWFCHCQLARIEGVRFGAGRAVERPCDPDDIYRAVMSLRRRGILGEGHVGVLARFGRRLAPPDRHAGDADWEAALWDQALDRLTTVLRGKGILA